MGMMSQTARERSWSSGSASGGVLTRCRRRGLARRRARRISSYVSDAVARTSPPARIAPPPMIASAMSPPPAATISATRADTTERANGKLARTNEQSKSTTTRTKPSRRTPTMTAR